MHPLRSNDDRRPIHRGLPLLLPFAVALFTLHLPATAGTQDTVGPIKSIDIVVLSTMLTDKSGVGEWGFSALVETDGHRILFDTGARPGTVLQNSRELKVDLSGVTDVILSHHHGDHVGGLLTLRRELGKRNPDALKRVYVGAGIFLSRLGPDGRETNEALALKKDYETQGGSFVVIKRNRAFPGGLVDRSSPAQVSRTELELQAHDPVP